MERSQSGLQTIIVTSSLSLRRHYSVLISYMNKKCFPSHSHSHTPTHRHTLKHTHKPTHKNMDTSTQTRRHSYTKIYTHMCTHTIILTHRERSRETQPQTHTDSDSYTRVCMCVCGVLLFLHIESLALLARTLVFSTHAFASVFCVSLNRLRWLTWFDFRCMVGYLQDIIRLLLRLKTYRIRCISR